MSHLRFRRLSAAAIAAILVATIDTVGWFRWRNAVSAVAVNPQSAVEVLTDGPMTRLPSFVVRLRRMVADDFGGPPVDELVSTLSHVGRAQRTWLPADASGFINLAREELLRGRPQQSIDALSKALVRDPTSAFLHRLQALFLFSIGDRRSALSELAVAEAIAPGLEDPEIEVGERDQRELRMEGLRLRAKFYPRRQTETALAVAQEMRIDGNAEEATSILKAYRGQPDIEIEMARWAVEDGDYEKAVDLLLPIASRKSNPKRYRVRSWSVVAVARDLMGDSAGASSAADNALELDPESPAPYISLAGLAQGRGDLESALEHLRKAWGMRPDDTGLLTRIAWVAEQAGRPADALLAMQRAVEIKPGDPRLSVLLVELQLRSGRYAEAAFSLSEALDRHPTDPDLLRLADRLPREVGIR